MYYVTKIFRKKRYSKRDQSKKNGIDENFLKVSLFQKVANICKHFSAPEYFSVHRDSKMIAIIGMISSEKN